MFAWPDIEWSLIGNAQSEGFANFVKSSLRLFTANFLGFYAEKRCSLSLSLSLDIAMSPFRDIFYGRFLGQFMYFSYF